MKEYHKIEGLFARDPGTKKLLPDKLISPEVELLRNIPWVFTEKIDGTNVRVVWDGHKVSFWGRTDNTSIPTHLLRKLEEMFGGEANEQMFEQKFGSNPVILFGEGYGPKIQKGGSYRSDVSFILFDAQVGEWMLKRDAVEEIAQYFGIDIVPIVLTGTIADGIEYVKARPASTMGTAKMEGIVGHPVVELRKRNGERIIVKIKTSMFDELDKQEREANE